MNNTVTVIIVGISAWSVGLVIALITSAPSKVIYACILGIVLGCIGIGYSIRRAARELKTNKNK